jgi:hypothetical protein
MHAKGASSYLPGPGGAEDWQYWTVIEHNRNVVHNAGWASGFAAATGKVNIKAELNPVASRAEL